MVTGNFSSSQWGKLWLQEPEIEACPQGGGREAENLAAWRPALGPASDGESHILRVPYPLTHRSLWGHLRSMELFMAAVSYYSMDSGSQGLKVEQSPWPGFGEGTECAVAKPWRKQKSGAGIWSSLQLSVLGTSSRSLFLAGFIPAGECCVN